MVPNTSGRVDEQSDTNTATEAEADSLPGEYDPTGESATVGEGFVGAFIYTSWSTNRSTNVELAKIVEVSTSGKTVVAQRVGAEKVDGGEHTESVKPIDDTFGDEFRLHVRDFDGRPIFRGQYPYLSSGKMDGRDGGSRKGSFHLFALRGGETVHRGPVQNQ